MNAVERNELQAQLARIREKWQAYREVRNDAAYEVTSKAWKALESELDAIVDHA